MRIQLIAVGQKMPSWVSTGFATYAKRLPADCQLQLIEIAAGETWQKCRCRTPYQTGR